MGLQYPKLVAFSYTYFRTLPPKHFTFQLDSVYKIIFQEEPRVRERYNFYDFERKLFFNTIGKTIKSTLISEIRN